MVIVCVFFTFLTLLNSTKQTWEFVSYPWLHSQLPPATPQKKKFPSFIHGIIWEFHIYGQKIFI